MDTLRIRYSSAFGSGCRRMRFVIRTLVEPDRSVFVQDTVIDPITSSGQAVPGLVLLERKWTILTDISRPATTIQTSSSASGTRIQTFASIEPTASSLSFSSPAQWHSRSIERAVIPAWDLGVNAATQRLENALVSMVADCERVDDLSADCVSADYGSGQSVHPQAFEQS